MTLHRYWFAFDNNAFDLPSGTAMGCGITPWSEEDALQLLKTHVFRNLEVPQAMRLVVDVDVSTLDAKHVLPNMGVPRFRGVWFPLGYTAS